MKRFFAILVCIILLIAPSCKKGNTSTMSNSDYEELAVRIRRDSSLSQKDYEHMLRYLIDMYRFSIDSIEEYNRNHSVKSSYWIHDHEYWQRLSNKYPYATLFNATISENSQKLNDSNRKLQEELRNCVSIILGVDSIGR